MFSTLLMGGGGQAREKDHQNVKSLIIFARDCRELRSEPMELGSEPMDLVSSLGSSTASLMS